MRITIKRIYNEIVELGELARDIYFDTPSNSPAIVHYQSQMNERTNIKHLIADFSTVDGV